MFSLSKVSKELWQKLKRPGYRYAYLSEHVRRGIAHQIRALRDQREWNQGKLADELGKPQSVVSRLEDPSYGKLTIQTLLEVAKAFDVALQVRFVSYSDFVRTSRDLTTASMRVDSFDDDVTAKSRIFRRGPMVVARTNQGRVLNFGFIAADEPRFAEAELASAPDQVVTLYDATNPSEGLTSYVH